MNSSSFSRERRKRGQGLPGPKFLRSAGKVVIRPTRLLKSSIRTSKRASRSSSWTPKTARMITARVIRCVWGRSANGSPTGHVSISRRVISRISSP